MQAALLVALWLAVLVQAVRAEPAALVRDLWAVDVRVHEDLSYVEIIQQEYSFDNAAAIPLADRDYVSFFPAAQSLELLEAYVVQPDGTRLDVSEAARFTRPSRAAQDTPGFSGGQTTTVLFPQLRQGSRTHVTWRLTQRKPSALGFNLALRPLLDWPTRHMTVQIEAPVAVALHWAERGGFAVSDTAAEGIRRITAILDDAGGQGSERDMVSPSDFLPMFVASSLTHTEDIGAIYRRQSADRATVTPEIAAIAARIAGERTGLEAARAIHEWIATNIRYVAVYLDPGDGWVPHRAADVLADGYGDCKDHVVLLQALLAARGIRADAVLVDWGSRYVRYPIDVPQQFNHVIAWLPEFGLFANPTNPYARLGALDRRLAGKTAVIATEQGLVTRTPESRPDENRYRVEGALVLNVDGRIEGESRFSMDAGIEASIREDVAGAASTRDLADRMLAMTPEGGYGDLDTSDPKDLDAPFTVQANWASPHGVAFQDGEAYFSTPAGLDFQQPGKLLRPYLSTGMPRHHPVQVGARELTWCYTVRLPEGYAAVRLPSDVSFGNATGRYAARYRREGGEIQVERVLRVERDVYRPAEFESLQGLFFTALDDVRAVFVVSRLEARN